MTYRFPIVTGDRVALAPHLDLWMQGVRFGTVEDVVLNEENKRYMVRYSPVACVYVTGDDLLGAVNAVPGKTG